MKLSAKQALFAKNMGVFLVWVYSKPGRGVTFAEAYRPPDVAKLYAKQGRGIRNSLHTQRLAFDLNLFIDWKYQQSSKAYEELGDMWESLHPKNRWGGRFKRADGNHFEMQP